MTLWPETLWPRRFGENDTLARVTIWPETLWPEWQFGQNDSLARMTIWPEWPFCQRHFCQRHFGRWDSLASVTLAGDTLGYQRVNKNSIGGTIGKNLKKIIVNFQKKRVIFFSNFSLWSPLWNFYSPFGTPKEARKTGQSVTLAKVSLAKVSLWPKCHSGQSVTLAKVSLAKVSLWPKCLWPKCLWPKCLWPKCLWPKGHSGQIVILSKGSRPKCLCVILAKV